MLQIKLNYKSIIMPSSNLYHEIDHDPYEKGLDTCKRVMVINYKMVDVCAICLLHNQSMAV